MMISTDRAGFEKKRDEVNLENIFTIIILYRIGNNYIFTHQ